MKAVKIFSKKFQFINDKSKETLSIVIPELMDPNYGFYVWPCAVVLAQYIWYFQDAVKGRRILELSAGTALPGIVAAKCKAESVVLSDSFLLPDSLQHCKNCCAANELPDLPVIGITWGLFSPDLMNLAPVDIILGSDCFYNLKDFEDILVTVSFILEKNGECQFWCTYQERSSDQSIEPLLKHWDLNCSQVSLAEFQADGPDIANSGLPGNHTIQMLKIFKRKPKIG
ncbi:methyltransferase-like protein 23 [Octopus sinensis]|uniref:Methyltransferase-like protein 23 n=1 Tax=Octopus sinensis TaxID=2607531 RepID=A0A6P7SSG1_9MOLL|nr:methyltransferase-like protein 23 [Octopus sinensis]